MESYPGGDKFFRAHPVWLKFPTNFLHNGYGSFPGVKQPVRDAVHTLPSNTEVKNALP
jgi:hypothetical protein